MILDAIIFKNQLALTSQNRYLKENEIIYMLLVKMIRK